MENLPPEALHDVAAYFQALSEPTRLHLLNILREGERNVGDLAQLTGTTAANVSRHMSLLSKHGMVRSESRGTSVYYCIADAAIYVLCYLVCGSFARQMQRTAQSREAFALPKNKKRRQIHGGARHPKVARV